MSHAVMESPTQKKTHPKSLSSGGGSRETKALQGALPWPNATLEVRSQGILEQEKGYVNTLNKGFAAAAPSGSAGIALSGLFQRNLGTPGRPWKITPVSPASTPAVFCLALLLNWPLLPENPSGCLGFHSLTHGVSED